MKQSSRSYPTPHEKLVRCFCYEKAFFSNNHLCYPNTMATITTEIPTSVPFLEFTDYGDISADLDMHQLAQGEVVRESSVIEYTDSGNPFFQHEAEYQVILHDQRMIKILGHSVEYNPEWHSVRLRHLRNRFPNRRSSTLRRHVPCFCGHGDFLRTTQEAIVIILCRLPIHFQA